MRRLLAVLALLLLALPASAQTPAARRQAAIEQEARLRQLRILQLTAEIRRTEKKLSILKEQLAALTPKEDAPKAPAAPEGPKQLVINDFAKGQKGVLATAPNNADSWFEVVQVLGKDEFVAVTVLALPTFDRQTGRITGRNPPRRSKPFIIRGQSTAGLADGSKVEIPGVLEVVDTKTLPSGPTHFVLSPAR